jgi:xylose isomerase
MMSMLHRKNLKEFQANLDIISDKLLAKQKETGVKLLWATQNLFSHTRYKGWRCDIAEF